jgi:hypothetical protein
MKSLFIAGVIFFIGNIILIFANLYKLDIDKYGKIVKMQIVKMPSSCMGTRVRYFVDYSYNGKIYSKATRGSFCEEHYVGELIDMKFLEGYDTILRPNESALKDLISGIILALFGLFLCIRQWIKMRK